MPSKYIIKIDFFCLNKVIFICITFLDSLMEMEQQQFENLVSFVYMFELIDSEKYEILN
jgi:hypothetical protein